MHKFLIYFISIIGMFLLQVTIFSFYPFASIKPDLLLVIVVISGLISGGNIGIKIGAGAGILQDVFLGIFFGKYSVSKILAGAVSGIFEKKIYKGNYILPPLIIFGITIIQENIVILFIQKTLLNINYFNILYMRILPVALYNGILGLILYPIFLKIFKNKDRPSWIND
ncbi:MAG: rod shape-determining protein MreD [Bacillota bacterium]